MSEMAPATSTRPLMTVTCPLAGRENIIRIAVETMKLKLTLTRLEARATIKTLGLSTFLEVAKNYVRRMSSRKVLSKNIKSAILTISGGTRRNRISWVDENWPIMRIGKMLPRTPGTRGPTINSTRILSPSHRM
jgi:hypothetical protein